MDVDSVILRVEVGKMPSMIEREKPLKAVFEKAWEAGHYAAATVIPEPMVIAGYAPISEGVCGFAWITIKPGTSPAARYAKKYLKARTGYYGGMEIWVSGYGQSMTRKEAFAEAAAAVLREAGIAATAGSRMD